MRRTIDSTTVMYSPDPVERSISSDRFFYGLRRNMDTMGDRTADVARSRVYADVFSGEDIARIAEKYEGSTAWAYDKEKYNFPAGKWKCNQFVYDVITEAGGTAPKYGSWPIVAADWANPNYHITDWEHVGRGVARQRGDVIAVKITSNNASGHCAIAVSDTLVMGAGQYSVTRGMHDLGSDAAVRRYTGW
jgi:cell wall-associated NlpC family hydrolase